MERLSTDTLLLTLSYLNSSNLIRFSYTSQSHHTISKHDIIWKQLLLNELNINEIIYPPNQLHSTRDSISMYPYYHCFYQWKYSFHGYHINDVMFINEWWKRFELWTKQYAPLIFYSLNPPASEDDINSMEQQYGKKIPKSLRLLYRFHNGQSPGSSTCGMFGGTHYYDTLVNVALCPLSNLLEVTHVIHTRLASIVAAEFPSPHYNAYNYQMTTSERSIYRPPPDFPDVSLEDCVTFAVSANAISKVFCLGPDEYSNKGGAVYVNSEDFRTFTPCHPYVTDTSRCYLFDWLDEYMNRLEEGVYTYQPLDLTDPMRRYQHARHHPLREPYIISLFPQKPLYNRSNPASMEPPNYGSTVSVSRGVELVACPAFIPDRSDPIRRNFFWSYSIRMRLLRNHNSRPIELNKCQLLSRHWTIYEPPTFDSLDTGGRFQQVDGEAVVGHFPILSTEYSQPDDESDARWYSL